MKILNTKEFYNPYILCDILEGYDFRTVEEFFDINSIDESRCSNTVLSNALNEYYTSNWQWCGINERAMASHIFYINEINESLRTHNGKPLIGKLKTLFTGLHIDCKYDYANHFQKDTIRVTFKGKNPIVDENNIGTNKINDCDLSEKFLNLIEIFLYYITTIEKTVDGIAIYLEPYYTENVNDKIKKNKYVYHITDIKNIHKIEKTGLRPKVGRVRKPDDENEIPGYRYFPEKIFCVGRCDTLEETIKNIKKIISVKKLKYYAIIEINPENKNNPADLAIDFWKDTAAKNIKNACYTFTAIPKQFFSNIYFDINDIK